MKIPVELPTSPEMMGAESTGTSAGASTVSIEGPVDPNTYVCGPGDVLELNFWGPQNFRLRIGVDLEGRTFISKVGYVAVAGKTLAAVRTEVGKKVRANYPGLRFDLTLINPRTFLVHVVENVKHPGTYSSHAIDRVSTVLARAEPTQGASRRQITIKHHDGTSSTADLVQYELTGDTSLNPFLLDGDIVKVPFAKPVVTIAGGVRRPGSYELIASKDLTELLALAGGFASNVARSRPIKLVRRNERQQETSTDLNFSGGAPQNVGLLDDDKLFVPTAEELQRTVLLIGAVVGADPLDAATTSKRLPFVEGDTVMSLLERAGGVRAPGDLGRSYISRPRSGQTPELISLDLDALLVRRNLAADKKIEMGDTIVIPPMQYSIRVEGAVARAGFYTFNPTFGIREYIAHAGGRTRLARDLDEVRVIDSAGKTRAYDRDFKPLPGDAILVPERNFSRGEIVQLVLAGAGLVLSGVAIAIAASR